MGCDLFDPSGFQLQTMSDAGGYLIGPVADIEQVRVTAVSD